MPFFFSLFTYLRSLRPKREPARDSKRGSASARGSATQPFSRFTFLSSQNEQARIGESKIKREA
jgi:hypothetical protein